MVSYVITHVRHSFEHVYLVSVLVRFCIDSGENRASTTVLSSSLLDFISRHCRFLSPSLTE